MNEFHIVLSTFPTEESARQIGTLLLKMQLVACLNLIPTARSLYYWQGKLCDEAETLAIFKTNTTSLPRLIEELTAQHPYDTPEILTLEISHGNHPYLEWLRHSLTPPTQS